MLQAKSPSSFIFFHDHSPGPEKSKGMCLLGLSGQLNLKPKASTLKVQALAEGNDARSGLGGLMIMQVPPSGTMCLRNGRPRPSTLPGTSRDQSSGV